MRLRDRIKTFIGREQRGKEISWDALTGTLGGTSSGAVVNAKTAEQLSVVLSCVNAISTGVATLPAWAYRRVDRGREVVEGHPLMRLIRQGPNEHQTWPDFIEWMVASTLLHGNGLVEIVTDGAGRLSELRPIPWAWASVQLLPNGRLAYDVTEMTGLHGGQGRMRRLLEGEVIHLKDRSDDGYVGRSRLQRAAETVSAGISIQQFAGSMYGNGINPSGALMLDGKLGDEQRKTLRESFTNGFAGSRNAAKALILDQGIKWQQISVSPEDAELLASRRFSGEELCRIYQVPPPIIGDLTHGTFTNSETLIRFFAQSTLSGWCRKIEAEFARSVFTDPNLELELDLSGLLRGDPETRWKSHEIALRNSVLDVNEVREIEGWNPRPQAQQST